MRLASIFLMICLGCGAERSASDFGQAATASQEKASHPVKKAVVIRLEPYAEAGRVADEPRDWERIGAHRDLPEPLPGEAAWTADSQDRPVWKVVIESPGAVALRLRFLQLEAVPGTVAVYEADPSPEPIRERLYTAADADGVAPLWSDLIVGSAAAVEYRPERDDEAGGAVPFRIDRISHMWRSPLEAF